MTIRSSRAAKLYQPLVQHVPEHLGGAAAGHLANIQAAQLDDPSLFGVVPVTQINLPRGVELGFRYAF